MTAAAPGRTGEVDAPLLDRIAADAWPPVEQHDIDGWRLRAASGVTRRANSALPSPGVPAGLDARLAVVRAFYAERGLPAQLQVSDDRLGAALEARGWHSNSPTLVMTGEVHVALHEPDLDVELTHEAGPDWLSCWWAVDGRGGAAELQVARTCLSRITSPAGYVVLRREGQVVGSGRGVVQQGWLGLFAMAVLPRHRSRGDGRRVLDALVHWGAEQGARQAYLQVAHDNARARSVYAAAGFQPAYGYSYRTAPDEQDPR